jgi:hypothetical protein
MKTEYKVGDIISYPIPGVCVGQCSENTVDKEARITKVCENINCNDGVIVEFELLDKSIIGTICGKLLNEKNYLV